MYAVQSNVHVGLEPAGYLVDKSVDSSNNDALETAKLTWHLLAIKKTSSMECFGPSALRWVTTKALSVVARMKPHDGQHDRYVCTYVHASSFGLHTIPPQAANSRRYEIPIRYTKCTIIHATELFQVTKQRRKPGHGYVVVSRGGLRSLDLFRAPTGFSICS
jgi:hypothetical protein